MENTIYTYSMTVSFTAASLLMLAAGYGLLSAIAQCMEAQKESNRFGAMYPHRANLNDPVQRQLSDAVFDMGNRVTFMLIAFSASIFAIYKTWDVAIPFLLN